LGEVGADILAMDVIERSPDLAVDDIVVALPAGRQPDTLITAAEGVEGVHVESVRPDPGVAARHKEWELVEAIAADPKQAVHTLARMLPLVLRAGWAMVVRTPANGGPGSVELLAGGGGVPDLTDVTPGWAPIDKALVLDPEAPWVPEDWKTVGTEMAAAPLWDLRSPDRLGCQGLRARVPGRYRRRRVRRKPPDVVCRRRSIPRGCSSARRPTSGPVDSARAPVSLATT